LKGAVLSITNNVEFPALVAVVFILLSLCGGGKKN